MERKSTSLNDEKIKIVITGASGFLGRNLVRYLANSPRYIVYALSSKGESFQKNNLVKDVFFYSKDIIYSECCSVIFSDAIVINCAYPRNLAGHSISDGLRYVNEVFLCAKKNLARGIINISSQSVYSLKREIAATEEMAVSLDSIYATGKYATELLLDGICRGTSVAYTNIRMASLIGPDFEQRVVNRLVKQALENGNISVRVDNQIFGFFDIEDAVLGIACMLKRDVHKWKTLYNLGSREGVNLKEIALEIKTLLGKQDGIVVDIEWSQGDEKTNSSVDAKLFYNDFAFEPQVDLKESIEKIKNNILSKYKVD